MRCWRSGGRRDQGCRGGEEGRDDAEDDEGYGGMLLSTCCQRGEIEREDTHVQGGREGGRRKTRTRSEGGREADVRKKGKRDREWGESREVRGTVGEREMEGQEGWGKGSHGVRKER